MYLVNLQPVLHSDGPRLLAGDGAPGAVHLLYAPGLALWRSVWEPLGVSGLAAAASLSAVCAGIGVGCLYGATRWLAATAVAGWTAALAASCPAVFFFATTVEIHAMFFATCGLVAVATAALCSRPGARAALLAGAACGLSYLVHRTGALLPLLPIALLAARGTTAPKQLAVLTTVLLAAHGLIAMAGSALLAPSQPDLAADLLLRNARASLANWPELVGVLAREWVWAYLPLSLAFVAGWWTGQRRLVLAVAVVAVPYAVLTFLLLAFETPTGTPAHEKGAYFLPLVWPCAWLVARALPRTALIGCVLLALGVGQLQIRWGVDLRRNVEFAAGLQEAFRDRPPLLIIGDWRDWEACLLTEPSPPCAFVTESFVGVADLDSAIQVAEQRLLALLDTGQAIVITERALAMLHRAAERGVPNAARFRTWFDERFARTPIAHRGLRGERLSAR